MFSQWTKHISNHQILLYELVVQYSRRVCRITNYGQNQPIHELVWPTPTMPISRWFAFLLKYFPVTHRMIAIGQICLFLLRPAASFNPAVRFPQKCCSLVWQVDNSMNCKFQIGLVCSLHCKYTKTCIANSKLTRSGWAVRLCLWLHFCWKFLFLAHFHMTATICIASCLDMESKFEARGLGQK